jgi:hypothetical protein
VLQSHCLENSVKKHGEFNPSVEERKEEVEDGSKGTDSYTAVIIPFFCALVFTFSTLAFFFIQVVVTMVYTYTLLQTYKHACIHYITLNIEFDVINYITSHFIHTYIHTYIHT